MASTPTAGGQATTRLSAWSPLLIPLYRALWLAALFSNIGTYMHNIVVAWVMTGHPASPMLAETIDCFLIRSMVFVSLLPTSVMLHRQTAAGLPM